MASVWCLTGTGRSGPRRLLYITSSPPPPASVCLNVPGLLFYLACLSAIRGDWVYCRNLDKCKNSCLLWLPQFCSVQFVLAKCEKNMIINIHHT